MEQPGRLSSLRRMDWRHKIPNPTTEITWRFQGGSADDQQTIQNKTTRPDTIWPEICVRPSKKQLREDIDIFLKENGNKDRCCKRKEESLKVEAYFQNGSKELFPKFETITVKKLYLHCPCVESVPALSKQEQEEPLSNQIRRNDYSITRTRCKLWRETEHEYLIGPKGFVSVLHLWCGAQTSKIKETLEIPDARAPACKKWKTCTSASLGLERGDSQSSGK